MISILRIFSEVTMTCEADKIVLIIPVPEVFSMRYSTIYGINKILAAQPYFPILIFNTYTSTHLVRHAVEEGLDVVLLRVEEAVRLAFGSGVGEQVNGHESSLLPGRYKHNHGLVR